MARRLLPSFRRFRVPRGLRKAKRWTANANVNIVTAPNALSGTTIVQGSDYQIGTTAEDTGTTVVRIRGSFCVHAVTAASFAVVTLAVVKHAAITGPFVKGGLGDYDAGIAAGLANLIEDEVLWQRVLMLDGDATDYVNLEVDIQAKRRLDGEIIRLFVVNGLASTSSIQWSTALRALLVGP